MILKTIKDSVLKIKIVCILRYLLTLLYHKWSIIYSGLYANYCFKGTDFHISYKRLLMHDMSKFSSSEFTQYANYYFGNSGRDTNYADAWKHHYENNDHHWEHFIPLYKPGEKSTEEMISIAKQMPEAAVLEMVADWFAANIAYYGAFPQIGKWTWAKNANSHLGMHPHSKIFLYGLLSSLGYEEDLNKFFNLKDAIEENINENVRANLVKLQALKIKNEKYYPKRIQLNSLFIKITYPLICALYIYFLYKIGFIIIQSTLMLYLGC